VKTTTKTITVEIPERVIRLKRKRVDPITLQLREEKKKGYAEGYAAARKKFEKQAAGKKERWKKIGRQPEKVPLLVVMVKENRVLTETALYFKKEKVWVSSNTGETMKIAPILWCNVIPILTTEHITRVIT
jgi:ribosomal protein L39E